MEAVRDLIARASRVTLPLLIEGETGTGKELVARAVHRLGSRPHAPFVAVNCASLPASLVESELFGHERGTFTGATEKRAGRIAAAEGGTLLLDEVEDLGASLQGQLLRFLAEGELQRLGCDRAVSVSVRVIAASNQDLAARVREGKFRADLYHRLNVLRIALPPLRQHSEDIPELVRALLVRVREELALPNLRVTPEVLDQWAEMEWTGNVRELENHIRRSAVLGNGDEIRDGIELRLDGTSGASASLVSSHEDHLLALLRVHAGNLAQVARELGVSRQAVWKRMRRAGLGGRDFRVEDCSRASTPTTTRRQPRVDGLR